ncbi:MAG TPA: serine hydrolase [Thermoanaerobaculia bacterium]|nr:serine hydrolase [Thermoanaerobaculia bacterium]
MRLIRVLFLIALSPALLAQSIDTAAVDRLARATMARWKVPAMAIGIVQNDRVTYLKGFGATPDTLFQIASTTKAFTTTAMAMLVDEKKMSWDDPVRKYIEYFHLADPCADSLVTLRDIVSHRSGLSRHDELWDYTGLSREDIIRHVGTIKLTKPFRSAYQYSNIMIMTAGEAVASAAKMPWSDFVKTHIFDPLGMHDTVVSKADWERSEHATGYGYDAKKDLVVAQPAQPYESLAPAGTIKSSARDMVQWIRFHLNDGLVDGKRLVSAEALNETKSPQTIVPLVGDAKEENPETNLSAYGMAWRVQDYRGELLISHGGALNGFRTQVDLLPKQHAGFVVMANLGRGLAVIAMRNALADMLLGKPARDWNGYYLALDAKERASAETKKRERDAKRHLDTKPSRELAAYAGTYTNAAYGPCVVTLEGDHLALQYGRLKLPLTHYHFDTFSAVDEEEDIDEQIVFSLDADGDVKKLTLFGEEFSRSAAATPPL